MSRSIRPAEPSAWLFVPFLAGHFISSLLRSVTAVLAPQLIGIMHVTPVQLGLLASAYHFAFAVGQLPVGIALDRFGPRRVQSWLLPLAAAGTLLFALGHGFATLFVARFLSGLGLAACFMAAVKASTAALPPHRLPMAHSTLIACGGLGAVASTWPVDVAMATIGWPLFFIGLAALLALLAAAFGWLVPPDAPAHSMPRSVSSHGAPLWRDARVRRIGGLLLLPHAAAFGMQGVWMGRWLSDVAGLSDADVSIALAIGMAALVAGPLLVGKVSSLATRRGHALLDVAGWGTAVFVAVQLLAVLAPPWAVPVLSVLFMLAGAIAGLDYTLMAQSVPPALAGRASTWLNLLISVGAFAVQVGFGVVIGAWPTDVQHHQPAVAYRVAMALLVLLQLPGLAAWWWRRRSTAQPVRP